jgi:outer membrane autotransporter protein
MSSTKLLLVICVTAISLFQIPNSKANALPAYTVTGPNATYTNNGTLTGEQIGIYSDTANNSITNNGTVNAGASDYSGQAFGVESSGASNTITNSGTIQTIAGDAGEAYAIYSFYDSNRVTNSSIITATAGITGKAYGIYSLGDYSTLTNSGNITAIAGDSGQLIGINSYGLSSTLSNTGTITAIAGDSGQIVGINFYGDSNILNNSGTIYTTAGDSGTSVDLYSNGNSSTINNSGAINTTAGVKGTAVGIQSNGDSNTITNSGAINATTGDNGTAVDIQSNGDSNTITNSGAITATAGNTAIAAGIVSQGDRNTTTNSGNITATTGENGQAYGINSSSYTTGNIITNSGTISTKTGNNGVASSIYFIGDENTITNSGNISATAGDGIDTIGQAYGIYSYGNNNTITNTGNIYATTGNSAIAAGILSQGDGSTIFNTGTIKATAIDNGGAAGILSQGDRNTITNSGNISATARDSALAAYGIYSISSTAGSTITNSGTITASGGAGSTVAAIHNDGILDSLTNSGIISGPVAINSTLAGFSSIGTITNSGTIDGDINISGQDVSILGGSGITVGALTGGTIALTSGNNLTFGSGNQLLADNINVGTGTVTNEGSLYLNSTQSITGNYAQSSASSYNVSINSTTTSQLNVTGTASLAGTVNATGGNGINGNTRWTVMTAGNGINGTYANVTSDLDLVNFALAYDANDVYMTAQANYTSAATNQNQKAVATGLQTAFYSTPSTAGQSVLDQINPMSASQAQTAFNSLSGEGISAQQTANFSATNLIVDASRRQANYWLMDECQTKASANQPNKSRHNVLPASCASRDNKRFRSWLTGVGASDSLDGSSSMGSASVSTRTGGGVVGFDYEVSSHLLVGGMVGGTASNYNVSARSSTGTDSSGQVGLYSVAKWENFYVNSIFNYGYFSGESTRYVTGVGSTAEQTGTTSSNAFTGRMEVGYRMDHPLVNVMPFVAMQATSLQMNSFTESNTDNLGLSVAGNTTMSEPGSLGIQLDRSFDVSDKWTMYPLLRMAWVHEFQTDRSINASLQALPTSNWTVNGASAAYNAANVGISFQAMNKQGIAIFASGNAEASSTTQSYMGELGVKWLF